MYTVAIVGAGGISGNHIEAFLDFPERCRIEVIADINREAAEEQCKKYGLECRIVTDPMRVAEDHSVDLVAICTPPASHATLSIACLEAGKNVILEKPMAPSLEECERILDAADRSGKLFSVIAQNRFRTPAWRMKKVLDSGILGDIRHIQVNSYWWRTPAYYDMDWRGTWEVEGGGCTLIHSVHHIDLMLWMVGMPYEILSVVDNLAHENSEVEDISMSLLRFKPHILGQLTSSLVHHGEDQSITVQADRGGIAMPWKPLASTAGKPDNGFPIGNDAKFLAELEGFYNSIPALEHEGHAGQVEDVLNALDSGREPLLTGRDALNAINVIQGVYESAFMRRPVALPLKRNDGFYTREGLLGNAVRFHKKSGAL